MLPAIAAPLPDTVYLQEVGRSVTSSIPLTAVGTAAGRVYAGTKAGLVFLDGEHWSPEPSVTGAVHRLTRAGGKLWALTDDGLLRLQGSDWERIAREPVSDLCEYRGQIVAVGGRVLWTVREHSLDRLGNEETPFPVLRLAVHQESLYLLGSGRVTVHTRSGFGGLDSYGFSADRAWDWGALPSSTTRDMVSFGSRLVVATDRGLGVLRGMSMTSIRGGDGLPVEDATCLAAGFTNDLWIGTTQGAIRQVGDTFQYFAGQRWLPSDEVHAIAVQGRTVYVATAAGLGVIEYEPFTLQKKAGYYEEHLEEWGQKRLGFVHKLEWDSGLQEYVREVSDNDGGYSGDYLAAESYRFAATGDPAARREATNTFHALCWLEQMTGIPGFPARAVWAKGERGHKSSGGSGGYPAEWHDTADGRFEWKGDTSSDEICSHFYAIGLFLELAAHGPEIGQAKGHLARIASHLIDHQWRLIDLDGLPTRWGRWDPEYFLTEEGRFDRGLQAVELLSFMKTAESITGEPRFAAAYQTLVGLGYPGYTLQQRQVFPPDSVAHFDDQLAFWSYWNLIRRETDPELRALYRRSFERSYELIRVEQQPWFNFLHRALGGDDTEAQASIAHLRDWPLDLRVWSYQNSHRADLRTPPGYVSFMGGIRAFSPREREPMRWDNWTMQADGGTGGRDVVEPSGWLLAYWMGRYYGFIAAPADEAEILPFREHSLHPEPGARPYEGPPRPR